MATLFKQYEFYSEAKAHSKINALPHVQDEYGNDVPNHKHTIVKLGYLWATEPTYNEEGEVETEGVRSTKYSVDVLWNDLESSPYGWAGKEIEVVGNGVHTFAGHNFS